jgi:hypothetical protein
MDWMCRHHTVTHVSWQAPLPKGIWSKSVRDTLDVHSSPGLIFDEGPSGNMEFEFL